MIHFYRTAAIAPGKFMGAIAFAKEVSAYFKQRHGRDVSVALPIGGNPNRIGWAASYESLGDLETVMGKMMADPEYLEMIRKAADNFIAGSIHDEMWRSV